MTKRKQLFGYTLALSVFGIGLGTVPAYAAADLTAESAPLSYANSTLAIAAPAASAAPAADATLDQRRRKKRKKRPQVVRDELTVGIKTGPSPWRGAKLVHPLGGPFIASVTQWANLVQGVMVELKIPDKYLPGILAQIQQESAGVPDVVNLWDSNAKAGTPSMGLLQLIASTFQANAPARYNSLTYQKVPYANVYAGLNYAQRRYGTTRFEAWNQGQNSGY